MELLNLILSDYYRVWPQMKRRPFVFIISHMFLAHFWNASFMTMLWFRIASFTPPSCRFVFVIIYRWINYLTGIQLPIDTKVGEGLYFPHYSCIVISKRTIIGNNCTIFQGVTLGKTIHGCPTIGNNVIICANSTVVGNVRIGNNAFIGAGSVVVNDVPDDAVVVGNPSRIISYKGKTIAKGYC